MPSQDNLMVVDITQCDHETEERAVMTTFQATERGSTGLSDKERRWRLHQVYTYILSLRQKDAADQGNTADRPSPRSAADTLDSEAEGTWGRIHPMNQKRKLNSTDRVIARPEPATSARWRVDRGCALCRRRARLFAHPANSSLEGG